MNALYETHVETRIRTLSRSQRLYTPDMLKLQVGNLISAKFLFSFLTVEDRAEVTTYIKSYTGFQFPPKCMTSERVRD